MLILFFPNLFSNNYSIQKNESSCNRQILIFSDIGIE